MDNGRTNNDRIVTIRVYRLRMDDLRRRGETLYRGLSEEDKASADRFRSADDRLRRIGSAYLMQKYVGEGIYRDDNGKPRKAGAFFNVSHGGEYVVIALAPCEVGVDVEPDGRTEEEVFSRVATEEERASGDFGLVWTLKESLLKCVGTGLVADLKSAPAFPEGKKEYGERTFYCAACLYDGHRFAVTAETDKDAEVLFYEERLQ